MVSADSLLPNDTVIFYHSLTIFFFCFLILKVFFSNNYLLNTNIAFLKSLIFYIYFTYFTPDLNLRADDLFYFSAIDRYLNTLSIENISIEYFNNTAQTYHFIYPLISTLAVLFLGKYYTSLIVMNIIIITFLAILAGTIIKDQKYKWHRQFTIFILIFPELLAYSSATAGKECLVILVHILFIKSISLHIFKQYNSAFNYFIIAVFLSFFIRLYLPFIFFLIFLLSSNFIRINSLKLFLISAVMFVMVGTSIGVMGKDYIFYPIYMNLIIGYKSLFFMEESILSALASIPYGIIHFILTPLPINVETEHNYLFIPSILNLIFIPLLILGLIKVFFNNKKKLANNKFVFERFLFYYFFVFLFCYSLVDFLNGPRHRIQIVFALVFFIIIGFNTLKMKYINNKYEKA